MSVQNQITRLNNAKSAIKTAIEDKGVAVPSETKLDGLASLIDDISVGGGSSVGYDVTSVSNSDGTQTLEITDLTGWSLTCTNMYIQGYTKTNGVYVNCIGKSVNSATDIAPGTIVLLSETAKQTSNLVYLGSGNSKTSVLQKLEIYRITGTSASATKTSVLG